MPRLVFRFSKVEQLAEVGFSNGNDPLNISLYAKLPRKTKIQQFPSKTVIISKDKLTSMFLTASGSAEAIVRDASEISTPWEPIIHIRSTPNTIKPIKCEKDNFGGGGVMVWAGISLNGHINLHVFEGGSLTDQRYCEEILEQYEMLWSTATKLQQNYVEIIIDDIAFSALVDSGASFSVISDGLR
ncbi:hypothetical protein LAZ67_X001674 [Cordylochernes scorpioides]|uniref:Peptidase A2 domain-containing protein n=1 Tax=Cordylochernes scorpioides TaxID=51811 RepID=A0ABY6LXI9_9ARAC|nr:hypothetical protein LAZ67_X001674 [Cordylochernes scorpioides]